LAGYVPTSRTLTINGTTQDLSADRTFTVSTGITIGTTAITSGTVGCVLFEGTGNVVSESANLFWDNTNGRLGIGTSSPSVKLDISGTGELSRFGSSTNYWTFSALYSPVDNKLEMVNGGGVYYRTKLVNNTYDTRLLIGDYQSFLSFGSYSNQQRLTIRDNGNVLINTTTDAGFKLDVNGTARVSVASGTLLSQFTVISSLSRLDISPYDNTTYGVILRPSTNNGGSFVPISLWGTKIQLEAPVHISANATGPNASAQLDVTSTTKGFLPPRTNLTSNISTPAQGLMTYITGSGNGGEGLYYYNSGSTPGWRQVADTTFVSASLSGSAGYVPVFTGANSVSSSVIFQSGSNVGIGTITPSHNLYNTGTTALSQVFSTTASLYVYNGRTAHDSTLKLENASGDLLYFGGSGLLVTGNTTIGNGTSTLSARLGVKGSGTTSATTALLVQNSNASASLAVLDNGNVGIGTTSPSSSLHLYNSANVDVIATIESINARSPYLLINHPSRRYRVGANISVASAFEIYDENAAAARLLIQTNGNIGINTTTDAGFKLDVNGTARVQTSLTVTTGKVFSAYQSGTVSNDALKLTGSSDGTIFGIQNSNATGFSGIEYLNNLGTSKVFTGFNNSDGQEFRFNNFATNGFIDFKIGGASGFRLFTTRNVGIGTTTDIASSKLTIESTTQGFLPPRMTTTQKNAIATPAEGLMIYDTVLKRPCFYDGTSWVTL
jgi:hypothetical protein